MSTPPNKPRATAPWRGKKTPVATAAATTTRMPRQTSLERKLELLEARFTIPAPPVDPRSPSEATLGPFSSPNASAHSFGFGTPSLSNLSTRSATTATLQQHTDSNGQPLPLGSVRSKRQRHSPWAPNNLLQVSQAAERHMRKVAVAASSLSLSSSLPSSPIIPPLEESRSASLAAATESNQTLITGHLRPKPPPVTATMSCKVVQESPPLAVTPHKRAGRTSASGSISAGPATTATSAKPSSAMKNLHSDKRKSILPTKRELPSVKENFDREYDRTATTTATTGTGDAVIAATNADQHDRSRKRTRLPFTDRKIVTTVASPAETPAETAVETAGSGSGSMDAAATAAVARPALRKATAANNTSLYDFFGRKGTGKKPRATTTSMSSSPSKRISAQQQQQSKLTATTTPHTPSRPTGTTSSRQAAPLTLPDNEQLRAKCLELERACKDKDEQLAAVSNNRTIVHTALKQALQKRQAELVAAESALRDHERAARPVMEELVRRDATVQAVTVREALALAGARLGRIVFSRAGMRSVETWEDGHASKSVALKRQALQEKRLALEKRHTAAKRAVKQMEETKENATAATATAAEDDDGIDDEADKVGGIVVRTPLEAMEAVESVKLHLGNVRKQEKELVAEELALNDEKCAHIRALKRVASEDSSRFRSRPKLHDRYVLRALLGKGGFSEVWKAYDLVEMREVAVKIHQLDPRWPDAKKENYTKHVSREYEIHRNVRHPRIVSLFDVFEIDNNSFATVLELCNGTDLDAVLKEKKRLPERDARAILLQILLGMHYLSHPSTDGSRQGVIHYDLKPNNLLFDEYGDAKITDFGLSKIVDTPDPAESMELTSQGAGTYWYLPPECFVVTENVRISNKVDVWSIGVIFFQMLYGKRPFGDGQSQDKLLSDHTILNAHEVKFPDKPSVSDEGKQFIQACLTYDQAFRPTIAQICQNSYVLTKQF